MTASHRVTEYCFQVSGNPEPWQVQVRNAVRTDAYERRVAWQEQIRKAARAYWDGKPELDGLVSLSFAFYLPWPPRAPKRAHGAGMRWRRKHIGMKPELSNLQKAAEDALRRETIKLDGRILGYEPVIIRDDNQVIGIRASKDYADDGEGYTIIWIEEA